MVSLLTDHHFHHQLPSPLTTLKITISTGQDARDRFEMHHNDDGEVSFTIREDNESQEVSFSIKSPTGSTTVRGSKLNISVEPQPSFASRDAASFDTVMKTATNQIIKLRVAPSQTVMQLKEQLMDAFGIPSAQSKFFFAGREMKEEHLLSDYRLRHGCVVDVLLQLRGS